MDQRELKQKINKELFLPDREGCDEAGKQQQQQQQGFLRKAPGLLTCVTSIKAASLVFRQTRPITLKRVNRVLWTRLRRIWSKHNEHNSAAASLGIWRVTVLRNYAELAIKIWITRTPYTASVSESKPRILLQLQDRGKKCFPVF